MVTGRMGAGRSRTKGDRGSGLVETIASEKLMWAPGEEGRAGEREGGPSRQTGVQAEGWGDDSMARV